MSNTQQFVAELNRWVDDNARKQPVQVLKKVCQDAIRGLVLNTPVGNPEAWAINEGRRARGLPIIRRAGYVGGHMRRNWQANIGTPLRTELPGVDPSGSRVTQEMLSVVSSINRAVRVHFTCPVPYAEVIEFGSGTKKPWSKQAPNGVVGPTLEDLRQLYAVRR